MEGNARSQPRLKLMVSIWDSVPGGGHGGQDRAELDRPGTGRRARLRGWRRGHGRRRARLRHGQREGDPAAAGAAPAWPRLPQTGLQRSHHRQDEGLLQQ